MNRTPAHRIVSCALGLASAFVGFTLFVIFTFLAIPSSGLSAVQAQFGNTEEGFFDDQNPDLVQDSYTRGDAQLRIKEIDEYIEEVNEGDSSLGVFTNNSFNNQLSYAYCIMVGCFQDSNDNISQTSGIIPGLGKAIGYLYETPPASSQQYIAYVLDSAGINIAQPAYAQSGGLGFSSLLPILNTWVRMRNLAYLFFVVMFVVIGFMIMFRQKLGGQTVVTIQQAIPQIIISLLAVTFSFAIAGLLIDMMYVIMYLMMALFDQTNSGRYIHGSLFTIGGNLLTQGVYTVNDSIKMLVESAFGNTFIANIFGGFAGFGGAVVFAIAITIRLFTLFFMLLNTYIGIILSIVTAPIALMLGAIPGKNNFSTWVKGLIGNLAAFPTVLFILLLFESLTNNVLRDGSGGFVPPYLGGNGSGAALSNLIGIGMILIIPTIVEEVKKVLGAGDGVFGQFGKALKESVGAGWKRGGGAIVKGAATGLAMGVGAGANAAWAAARGNNRQVIKNRAIIGAAAPVALRMAPTLIGKSINLGKEQAAQLVTQTTIDAWNERRENLQRKKNSYTAEDISNAAATNESTILPFDKLPNDVANSNLPSGQKYVSQNKRKVISR